MYIRQNNALENKDLIKIANGSQWKITITTEYEESCHSGIELLN